MDRIAFDISPRHERKAPRKEVTWSPLSRWRNRSSSAIPDEEEKLSSSRQKKHHKKGGGVGTTTTSVPYTKNQIQEFLHQHDQMGDNSLSRAELKKAFADMGSRFPAYRAWQAMAVATGADGTDGDGRINKEEMEELVNYVTRLNLQHQVRP